MNDTKLVFLIVHLSLLLLIVSCGGNKNKDNAASEKKFQIAVIPKGTAFDFWKSIHVGAKMAEHDFGVQIFWQGPEREDDRQMQIQVVQNFISRKVDAIVLSPLDSRALISPVKAAKNRNIPVIIMDSGLDSDIMDSFVATNNTEGGKVCARQMNELLNGKGKVILLRFVEGSSSTEKRSEAFIEEIGKIAPGIELISSNQYAGSTMEKAFQTAQNLLNRYGQVDGIFCVNNISSMGMLRALETSGLARKIKFVGFDTNEVLIEALKNGKIQGLAAQDPVKIGYESVHQAVKILNHASIEKRIDTGITMITINNIEDSSVQKLIHPDFKKWLGE